MNKNKLIEIFISNLANAVVHRILEKAINLPEYAQNYNKEFKNSWKVASDYRQKINPIDRALPFHDIEDIKTRIINKVNSELNLRISKGYENIDLSLVKPYAEEALRELKVTEQSSNSSP